jgi:glutamate-5-semialdehyde dehydrogenase
MEMSELHKQASRIKEASDILSQLTTSQKNEALSSMADAILEHEDRILSANAMDVQTGQSNGLNEALLDRLRLNHGRLQGMAEGLHQVVRLEDPIGEETEKWTRTDGLTITQIRVPLGVVGMIYEARPNVTVDASGLCLKTGNGVLLRGSSSAYQSNAAIVGVLQAALERSGIPKDAIGLVEAADRESVQQMLKLNEYLDVLIPRGGAGLIRSVVENATVPVLETGAGNCHLYIDESAKPEMAISIALNAKTSRPAVCNAIETILVHQSWAEQHLPALLKALANQGVSVFGCEGVQGYDRSLKLATDEDFSTEFLDLVVSMKIVSSVKEAITHIQRYGSRHSEAIITEHAENASLFLQRVDAAAVYHNASTRFTDGFEFGFGAEIGISTQKLHARGPMGLKALTSTKYVIHGSGQIRV